MSCNISLAEDINTGKNFKFSSGECVLKPDGFIWKIARISYNTYIAQGYFEFCPNRWSWGNETALERDVLENDGTNVACPFISLIKQNIPTSSAINPLCAENGSCYGDTSTITGNQKNIYVNGYFRKDGTYVRSHFRSHR